LAQRQGLECNADRSQKNVSFHPILPSSLQLGSPCIFKIPSGRSETRSANAINFIDNVTGYIKDLQVEYFRFAQSHQRGPDAGASTHNHKAGCPILSAFFAERVGIHEPQPASP
jgi:histone deacetylase complex regulatory component SIN3